MPNVRIKDQTTDTALTTGDYVIVDSETEGTRKYDLGALAARVEALEQSGGSGLTQAEKNLILTLFSKAAYAEDDASTAYDALESLWASTTRTITYNLSHVSSSNSTASIESGQSYTTTLTAASDYTLNTVTVLMGGVNVTSQVYSSGTITIPNVTGDIVITATAVPNALYPLETGSKTFLTRNGSDTTNRVISVSGGNVVTGQLTTGYSYDMKANISNVSLNTNLCNDTANNSVGTAKLFTIPSGSTVTTTFTVTSLEYSNSAILTKQMNVAMRNQSGTALFLPLANSAYNTIIVDTPVTNTFTAESDLDIWNITIWMESNGSYGITVEFELTLTVDGVRYI